MTKPIETTDADDRKIGSTLLLVRGLVAIAFGIVAVVWPEITVKVFAVLMGILLVISGIIVLGEAFDRRKAGAQWIGTLLGGVALAGFGVAAIGWPGPTVKALAFLFGLALVVSGLIIAIESIVARKDDTAWGLFLAWGVLAVIFGAVMMSWPGITIGVIVILKGVFWIIGGILSIVTSRQVKHGALY